MWIAESWAYPVAGTVPAVASAASVDVGIVTAVVVDVSNNHAAVDTAVVGSSSTEGTSSVAIRSLPHPVV